MSTTTEVIEPTSDGGDEPTGAALPALLNVTGLPTPQAMQADMRKRIDDAVAAVRHDRGPVTLAQDAWPLLRQLSGAADYLKSYGRAIRTIEGVLRGYVEEEALEAVGEAEGVRFSPRYAGAGAPASNLTVPDGEADCDWHITREWDSEAEADWQSIVSVEARLTAAHAIAGGVSFQADGDPEASVLDLADADPVDFVDLTYQQCEALVYAVAQQAAEDTLARLDASRNKDGSPSSRKLEAWAKELGRKGLDDLAAIVGTAVKRRSRYRGVKVERA